MRFSRRGRHWIVPDLRRHDVKDHVKCTKMRRWMWTRKEEDDEGKEEDDEKDEVKRGRI